MPDATQLDLAREVEAVTRWSLEHPDAVTRSTDGTYTADALGIRIAGYRNAYRALRAAFYSFGNGAKFPVLDVDVLFPETEPAVAPPAAGTGGATA